MMELRLPEDVMEKLPSGNRENVVRYLSSYFEQVINEYDQRFQKRVGGAFGQPLSKYERSMLKDFLIDQTLGKLEEEQPTTAIG